MLLALASTLLGENFGTSRSSCYPCTKYANGGATFPLLGLMADRAVEPCADALAETGRASAQHRRAETADALSPLGSRLTSDELRRPSGTFTKDRAGIPKPIYIRLGAMQLRS